MPYIVHRLPQSQFTTEDARQEIPKLLNEINDRIRIIREKYSSELASRIESIISYTVSDAKSVINSLAHDAWIAYERSQIVSSLLGLLTSEEKLSSILSEMTRGSMRVPSSRIIEAITIILDKLSGVMKNDKVFAYRLLNDLVGVLSDYVAEETILVKVDRNVIRYIAGVKYYHGGLPYYSISKDGIMIISYDLETYHIIPASVKANPGFLFTPHIEENFFAKLSYQSIGIKSGDGTITFKLRFKGSKYYDGDVEVSSTFIPIIEVLAGFSGFRPDVRVTANYDELVYILGRGGKEASFLPCCGLTASSTQYDKVDYVIPPRRFKVGGRPVLTSINVVDRGVMNDVYYMNGGILVKDFLSLVNKPSGEVVLELAKGDESYIIFRIVNPDSGESIYTKIRETCGVWGSCRLTLHGLKNLFASVSSFIYAPVYIFSSSSRIKVNAIYNKNYHFYYTYGFEPVQINYQIGYRRMKFSELEKIMDSIIKELEATLPSTRAPLMETVASVNNVFSEKETIATTSSIGNYRIFTKSKPITIPVLREKIELMSWNPPIEIKGKTRGDVIAMVHETIEKLLNRMLISEVNTSIALRRIITPIIFLNERENSIDIYLSDNPYTTSVEDFNSSDLTELYSFKLENFDLRIVRNEEMLPKSYVKAVEDGKINGLGFASMVAIINDNSLYTSNDELLVNLSLSIDDSGAPIVELHNPSFTIVYKIKGFKLF